MKKNSYCLIIVLLIHFTSFAQSKDADTDAKNFFSALVGVNFTQMQSSGDIFKQSRFGTGYKIGLQFNMFPDYEFQKFYFRMAVSYSKELSESKNPVMNQTQAVTSKANLDFAGIELFFAHRFATDTKFDVYLGGGLQFQQKLNGDANAYVFEDANGDEFPVFTKDDFDAPLRFQTEGPKAALGPVAELGAFIPVGDKLLNIATGVGYSFFFTNSSAELKFEKVNLYLNASYEVF